MVRKSLVWLHRWTGLLMAGFLIVEGLTGALLVYRVSLERWLAPQLFAVARPGIAQLPLAELATRAERSLPQARIAYFWLEERQAIVRVLPRVDQSTGKAYELDFDHLYLDPWSGRELGRRREGDLSQGMINLVPFIYQIHMSLAAGELGALALGVVALAWTIDCFVGFYLTLPVARTRFLRRWRPAWRIKLPASGVRSNFDLHRAGGLWLLPLLFVFGWSSVMFNLQRVYQPVTRALLDYQDDMELVGKFHLRRNSSPRLGWSAAQSAGQRLLAQQALSHGFSVGRPYGMAYIEEWGVYTYSAMSSANVQAHGWGTSVWIDGNSGALISTDFPQRQHSGNTVETWLRALHFADLRDSALYRVTVFVVGLATVMLSVTGVYLWWKKRKARLHRPSLRRARSAEALLSERSSRGRLA